MNTTLYSTRKGLFGCAVLQVDNGFGSFVDAKHEDIKATHGPRIFTLISITELGDLRARVALANKRAAAARRGRKAPVLKDEVTA